MQKMKNVRPGVRFVVHDTHTSPLSVCAQYTVAGSVG